jgi:hypothetical protein
MPLARDDGLISTNSGSVTPQYQEFLGMSLGPIDIVDWPPSERDGYDMTLKYKTVVNLFHYRALAIMSSIADILGKSSDAAMFRARSELVRSSIVSRLLDRERGLFVDGEGSAHASLHANMFALAFGVIPEANRASILTFVKSKGMSTSVYGAQFLLEGLYNYGEDAHALTLLTARGQRSWAHMIYDLGATVTHEAWDPLIKPNEDWNHAWGAAPANIIPRWLMGVQPLTGGFETFLVAPLVGDLSWAELRLPTVRGEIFVRVDRSKGDAHRLSLRVPANSAAVVIAPCRAIAGVVRVDNGDWRHLPVGTKLEALGPGMHSVECHPD